MIISTFFIIINFIHINIPYYMVKCQAQNYQQRVNKE